MHAVQHMTERNARDIGVIAREHYDLVYRFCARRVGIDLACDAAQETFLTAQRVIGNFRGASSLTTWLLGIAHNECRRLLRQKRSAPLTIELIEAKEETKHEEMLVNRHALREAMSKLSPEHREVVLLHEIDGLSYDEAAEVLGIPAGTVKSRLHHAFLNLRRSLQEVSGEAR
jgi:RNA polymerase sigma-70 factor, ECF subfamily